MKDLASFVGDLTKFGKAIDPEKLHSRDRSSARRSLDEKASDFRLYDERASAFTAIRPSILVP
jgi:hypothetical protein